MPKISRNAPCPCGSGRKYKICCLAKIEKEEARWAERDQAGNIVVDWLGSYYPEETKNAITHGFCGSITPDQIDAIAELSEGFQHMFAINLGDWLTTEAETVGGDDAVRLIDLALRPGGASLAPAQRGRAGE